MGSPPISMNAHTRTVSVELPLELEHQFACAACGRETYHQVVAGAKEFLAGTDVDWCGEYWIIQCKGCKTPSFCLRSTNTEDFDYDEQGQDFLRPTISLYPSRIAGRPKPAWLNELPYLIREIFGETHSALCNGQRILAGIGIRATIEAVCSHCGITKGKLEPKIDGLTTSGKVTADGAAILHSLRFMGNEAAHKTKAHTLRELGTAFEVIESILFSALILPRRTAKLSKRTTAVRPHASPTTPRP